MSKSLISLFAFLIAPVGLIPISFAATIEDSNYIVEEFVLGLSFPTTMTFVGDDILVLQKNDGKVLLIQNGILQNEPVLDDSFRAKPDNKVW